MAERPAKRARRQISEDSSDNSDGEPVNVKRLDRGSRPENPSRPFPSSAMSRPRRTVNTLPPGSLSRSGSDVPEDHRKSLKLTVKMPASKLREVTTPSSLGQNVAVNSRDSFEGGQIMTGKRTTRAQNTSKLKDYSDSEAEEDFGEEDDDEEQSEDEDEGDEFEADTPSPQKPDPSARGGGLSKPSGKPALTFALESGVQESDKEGDGEEEELSEPDDADQDDNLDADGDEDDIGGDEDAERDVDMDAEGDEDSDDMGGSGSNTPKLQTKRQRGLDEDSFLALPMEPQIKKHLTEDEHRMRRLEMARRRKNLSEKRNEEEKTLTINRLLKRQAPKRRGKAMNPETLEAAAAADRSSPVEGEEAAVEKSTPYFSRWVNNKNGSRLGVPHEWFGTGIGHVYGPPTHPKLVEEISEG